MDRALFSRTPRNYDGCLVTTKRLGELLPAVLKEIGRSYQDRGDLLLAAWPEVIGPKFAPMTRAVSFQEGVLTVEVKNSSLYSLLVRHEKSRLLKSLQAKLPSTQITNIFFRIG